MRGGGSQPCASGVSPGRGGGNAQGVVHNHRFALVSNLILIIRSMIFSKGRVGSRNEPLLNTGKSSSANRQGDPVERIPR